jgi:hypothetical protein
MQWLVFSRLELAAAKALTDVLGAKLGEFLEHAGAETEWSCAAT